MTHKASAWNVVAQLFNVKSHENINSRFKGCALMFCFLPQLNYLKQISNNFNIKIMTVAVVD